MAIHRCPGQHAKNFKPEDVYEVICPNCNYEIEFFKDDPHRECPECRKRVLNPKLDLGCLEWCPSAAQCAAGIIDPVA